MRNPENPPSALEVALQLFETNRSLTRRGFLRGAAILAGAGALVVLGCRPRSNETPDEINESKKEKSLKEKILSFGWRDAENKEGLNAFVETLADSYLQLTQTPRLNKEDLVGENRTTFYQSRDEFVSAIRTVEPTFSPSQNQWGYTHYKSERVFIDIDRLKKQAISQTSGAGLPLLDALWHQWGYLDVVERTSGELINNPRVYLLDGEGNEPFRRYRGGVIYTDTQYGLLRFDGVWNETINVRRMGEQVGLEEIILARDYYQNGLDFFSKFTVAANISLSALYEMRSTSDLEGFAKIVGQNLPGSELALTKGMRLFDGINKSNRELIQQTGVFERIPKDPFD